jgi:hypothetical protein
VLNYLTYDQFVEQFGFREILNRNFPTPCETLGDKLVRITKGGKKLLYVDWLKINVTDPKDVRSDTDLWLTHIWSFIYSDPERLLQEWFKDNLECKELPFGFTLSKSVRNGKVIDGKYNSYSGRVIKNLFASEVYEQTMKVTTNQVKTMFDLLRDLLEFKVTHSTMFTPSMSDMIVNKDYGGFFAYLRGFANKASIFNPYTYFSIIQGELEPGGGKLFCPVLSWGAPVVAFHNAWGYNEMVGVDVIPSVIEKCEKLHFAYEMDSGPFTDSKKCTLIHSPSEDLFHDPEFYIPYRNYFDTVFFCPPYYNCELYPDTDAGWQSTTRYKTYHDWLAGYWLKTVALCNIVLKPGGTFAFVIVKDYVDIKGGAVKYPISKDMQGYCDKIFDFKKTLDLSWSGFKIKKQNHEKRENVQEHVHIYTKPLISRYHSIDTQTSHQ